MLLFHPAFLRFRGARFSFSVPFLVCALLSVAAIRRAAEAQPNNGNAVIGAITALRAETSEMDVRQDNGASVVVRFNSATTAQKVAPGQTDLSKAEAIKVSDVAPGDRVLVTLNPAAADPGTAGVARRIVVMASSDIARHNAEDRLDWTRRGVAGVVTAVQGNQISLEQKTLGAAAKFTVKTDDQTSFKRYAPDSVKFADAKSSKLSEVSVGDQLRARGAKSADGLNVDATEVIFGTFLSKAGTISSINAEAKEVTVKDLVDKKSTLVIRFTADSQVKRMPDAAGMASLLAAGRAGAASSGPAASPASAASASAATASTGVGRGTAPGGGRGLDVAQLLDSLPAAKFEDLKTGDTVVVSASKGARADQLTAITFLANAEALVQLAVAAGGRGSSGPAPSLAGLASSISTIGP
jgi:hypothetical protein